MSDGVDERAINFATAEFRRAAKSRVEPPGTPAATATVRARLRQRAALLASLVLLLVASSVGGAVLTWRHQHPDGVAAAPAPSATTSVAASPTPTPDPSLDQLDQVLLQVPDWAPEDGADACPSGTVTFAAGRYGTPGNPRQSPVRIVSVSALVLPAEVAPVQLAVLRCEVGETGPQQLVAYRLRPAGGYDLLGQVLRTDADVRDILAVTAGSAGTVGVMVANARLCCGQPAARQLTQLRSYTWNGASFLQTDGPRTFQADMSKAGVRFTVQLTYGPVRPVPAATPSAPATPGSPSATGSPVTTWQRTGTLRIRISNSGPQDAQLTLFVALTMARGEGEDWAKCAATNAGQGTTASCQLTLTAGSVTTRTLSVVWPVSSPTDQTPPSADGGVVQVRTGNLTYGEQPILVTAG